MHKQAWCMPNPSKPNEACLTLPYVLQQGIKLKHKNGAHCSRSFPESWSLGSLSLDTTIWDPDFSCDSAFSFVAAGMIQSWSTDKKIRINWSLPSLADLLHSWQERSLFQVWVNAVIKDTFFYFPILLLKEWRWIHIIIYRLHNNQNKIYIRKN